jgi:hypothetical protein
MSHYAKVENGIVTQVIVADQEFIDSGALGDPTQWIQTSYNTFGGVHRSGGTPLRKNYAGVGYLYMADIDAFVPPKVFESWVLNTDTGLWEAPIAYPDDGKNYIWNEEEKNWKETLSVLPLITPIENGEI